MPSRAWNASRAYPKGIIEDIKRIKCKTYTRVGYGIANNGGLDNLIANMSNATLFGEFYDNGSTVSTRKRHPNLRHVSK